MVTFCTEDERFCTLNMTCFHGCRDASVEADGFGLDDEDDAYAR